ncbi:MAG TPA: hypothetical protein VMT03_22770 [Polyangia bacterium]|nr:hypothetical protein [Polyangia bacterium]
MTFTAGPLATISGEWFDKAGEVTQLNIVAPDFVVVVDVVMGVSPCGW